MTREDRMRETGMELKIISALHPAVRTHPETGIKSLYVNKAHTSHFKDWTEKESKSLLEFLFHHQIREELTCRFSLDKNSPAFWDNRCVQHNPVNDYQGFRRIMHRILLQEMNLFNNLFLFFKKSIETRSYLRTDQNYNPGNKNPNKK